MVYPRRRIWLSLIPVVLMVGVGLTRVYIPTQPVEPPTPTQDRVAYETLGPPVPAQFLIPEASPQSRSEIVSYTVTAGDTAESIAAFFNLAPTSIMWSNDLDASSVLQIGQVLAIPPADGLVHAVRAGDSVWEIALSHGIAVDDLIRANPSVSPDALQLDQTLFVPGGAPPRRSTQLASRLGAPRPPAANAATSGGLVWPASGVVTEPFGWRTHPVFGTPNYHEGIDIAVSEGSPVQAVAPGIVTMAEWFGGYGLTVKVAHGGGRVSRYSHNSSLLVEPGDTVVQGQVIAFSGNTGVSTGPHLDFGVYEDGTPVDPLLLLP